MDAISNVFAAALAAYLIYVTHEDASSIGFSLNMAGNMLLRQILLVLIHNLSGIFGDDPMVD